MLRFENRRTALITEQHADQFKLPGRDFGCCVGLCISTAAFCSSECDDCVIGFAGLAGIGDFAVIKCSVIGKHIGVLRVCV